ncbi:tetratricopeptide repeat-containing protein [Rhizobium jaguaris]|uniref:Tetratricopeptide repeat-containing protein n=1 Tax=Rhizobium jaguaris TaxID=1312183 RepID=A0A387G5R9_9HYPH|nr:tetratricopeptide repeat-containing protein [Rhizobium jaguaris]
MEILTKEPTPNSRLPGPVEIIGKAKIIRSIYEGRDIMPLWHDLLGRVTADHSDAAAFFDLSIITNSVGQKSEAAIAQRAALRLSKTYRVTFGSGTGLNILVLVAKGDFMANTPIELLLEESNVNVLLHYVDADTTNLDDIPNHDIAFVAVAESTENLPVLLNLERLLRDWRGPIMNNAPRAVMGLSRDGVAESLREAVAVVTPAITRISRNVLQDIANRVLALEAAAGIVSYPFIVRPLDTHAGHGMEKIIDPAQLRGFLELHPDPLFYVASFIDYSSEDGKFRKQRIAFIDGKAYASHMAVSEHWMVHYQNARMSHFEDRRAEEAAWMTSFDEDFAIRHANAFAELGRCFGLDYFAIDCAELPDGRLLVFEADVGMYVHGMDSTEVFPYKAQVMKKLFRAFEAALEQRVRQRDQY